jgi:hypothetical protein
MDPGHFADDKDSLVTFVHSSRGILSLSPYFLSCDDVSAAASSRLSPLAGPSIVAPADPTHQPAATANISRGLISSFCKSFKCIM